MMDFIKKYKTVGLKQNGVVEVQFMRAWPIDGVSVLEYREMPKHITYLCKIDEVEDCVAHCTEKESGSLWRMEWWSDAPPNWIKDRVSKGAIEWGAPDPLIGHPSVWAKS